MTLPRKGELDRCRQCDLWRNATQGVPGAGARDAALMLVGEQPGDEEDLKGKAFIGPAGRLLDTLLVEVGLDRRSVFITNAVKHFKWTARGKRRLHQRPRPGEIRACSSWLSREIDSVAPRVIVCLGATAARAVLGREMPIATSRGRRFEHAGGAVVRVTYHPSSILRARAGGDPEPLRRALLQDLRAAARLARGA